MSGKNVLSAETSRFMVKLLCLRMDMIGPQLPLTGVIMIM